MNILEIDNFLAPEICEEVIADMEREVKSGENIKEHNGNQLFDLDRNHHNFISHTNDHNISIYPIIFTKLITTIVNKFDDRLIMNHFEICKWPTGNKQDRHTDFDYHLATSVLYLNDNYEGGETFVLNKKIKPKQGKLIVFNGGALQHGVREITKGVRYTIPAWYKGVA